MEIVFYWDFLIYLGDISIGGKKQKSRGFREVLERFVVFVAHKNFFLFFKCS